MDGCTNHTALECWKHLLHFSLLDKTSLVWKQLKGAISEAISQNPCHCDAAEWCLLFFFYTLPLHSRYYLDHACMFGSCPAQHIWLSNNYLTIVYNFVILIASVHEILQEMVFEIGKLMLTNPSESLDSVDGVKLKVMHCSCLVDPFLQYISVMKIYIVVFLLCLYQAAVPVAPTWAISCIKDAWRD